MAAKKKPAAETNTPPQAKDVPSTAELIAQAKTEDYVPLDDERPNDGDLCVVKIFSDKMHKAIEGPVSIFDAHRGVFFKCPVHGGGGSVVGPRRDNYKAERTRNVVAFRVVIPGHDPQPETFGVIDHARALKQASSMPPSTPAAAEE